MTKKTLSLAKFPDNPSYNHKDYVSNEYKGLDGYSQRRKAALNSSDNVRCWWIYEFLMLERSN